MDVTLLLLCTYVCFGSYCEHDLPIRSGCNFKYQHLVLASYTFEANKYLMTPVIDPHAVGFYKVSDTSYEVLTPFCLEVVNKIQSQSQDVFNIYTLAKDCRYPYEVGANFINTTDWPKTRFSECIDDPKPFEVVSNHTCVFSCYAKGNYLRPSTFSARCKLSYHSIDTVSRSSVGLALSDLLSQFLHVVEHFVSSILLTLLKEITVVTLSFLSSIYSMLSPLMPIEVILGYLVARNILSGLHLCICMFVYTLALLKLNCSSTLHLAFDNHDV